MGTWRSLYLELLRLPALSTSESIVEIGAGSPSFLLSTAIARRVAVDVSEHYRATFEDHGIEFVIRDLDKGGLGDLGKFDVAVCSDVFEHLLHPLEALSSIKANLASGGLLFSHVPNEYSLKTTLRIMMGRQEGLYFHKEDNEWTDPHLRRFTDIGYRQFLEQRFQYNIKITHLRYRGIARTLRRLGIRTPFCLEGGPTYVSTNNPPKAAAILAAVKSN